MKRTFTTVAGAFVVAATIMIWSTLTAATPNVPASNAPQQQQYMTGTPTGNAPMGFVMDKNNFLIPLSLYQVVFTAHDTCFTNSSKTTLKPKARINILQVKTGFVSRIAMPAWPTQTGNGVAEQPTTVSIFNGDVE